MAQDTHIFTDIQLQNKDIFVSSVRVIAENNPFQFSSAGLWDVTLYQDDTRAMLLGPRVSTIYIIKLDPRGQSISTMQ